MGRILVGTASWTDRSLLDAGWYPKGTTTAEEASAVHAVFRNVHRDYSVRSAERLQRLLAGGSGAGGGSG